MKRSKAAILLALIALFGSFEVFYASNMLFSDLGNAFMGLHDLYFIASIPAFMLALDFVLAAMYVARIYVKPHAETGIKRLYGTVLIIFSCIGAAASVLSGTVVYGSFLKPYPFPGYSVISLAVHVLLAAAAAVSIVKNKKISREAAAKEVTGAAGMGVSKMESLPYARRGVTAVYVVHTAVLFPVIFLTLNRFGALLWAPVYVQIRTLYLTFPFYIWLAIPMVMMANVVLYMLGFLKEHSVWGLINSIALFLLNIVLTVVCAVTAVGNTLFISAISPALALERLASMPIDSIIMALAAFGMSIYMLAFSVRYFKGRNTPFR